MTDWPNNAEVRAWAIAKRPDLVSGRGRLPRFVILAWNREHPDRPYKASEAYHGTEGGYVSRNCRCDRCVTEYNARQRRREQVERDLAAEDAADELLADA